jgi:hypothetical protein
MCVRCHTNTNTAFEKPKWHRSFTNAAECRYEFVHTELVQVFYDIKWISSGAFEFEKNPTNNPKNGSRYTNKT